MHHSCPTSSRRSFSWTCTDPEASHSTGDGGASRICQSASHAARRASKGSSLGADIATSLESAAQRQPVDSVENALALARWDGFSPVFVVAQCRGWDAELLRDAVLP